MSLKDLISALRLPFTAASLLPVILAIVWSALDTGKFHALYALLCVTGVILTHIGANTINDYFDWDYSDSSNPNASLFNGGARNITGDRVPRRFFLLAALACTAVLSLIVLIFIMKGRYYILLFSLAGLILGYFYSSPPFKFHSRGLGELLIFLAFGPVLSAGVCYAMTGIVSPVHFLVGIPAGLSSAAVLWINQFPDYEPDKASGKKNLTVRLGLKASSYFYAIIIFSFYLSIALLILYRIFSPWSALTVIMVPGAVKALGILFRNYGSPGELLPAQGLTIQFQAATTLLAAAGLLLGRLIRF